jgi:alanyl-tRNA synthetase
MRARRRQAQRPRQCRLHRAPSHLLRDARQFLVRRLFQGTRDRARLEPDHQGIRLPKDKLLVTVYHDDDEAFDLWKKIAGLPDDPHHPHRRPRTISGRWATPARAARARKSSTTTATIWGGPPGSPEEDGDRFIEIWNLVFMQFEQVPGGERNPPAAPSIDTGMGLERIAAVLQGKSRQLRHRPVRALIAPAPRTGVDPAGEQKAAHRVIADHLRASSFLIADGVLPSNEGRGYVLRRIMRRAMRHAQLLGARDPLMHRLVPALVREMGQAYPELVRAEALIEETLRLEETASARRWSAA